MILISSSGYQKSRAASRGPAPRSHEEVLRQPIEIARVEGNALQLPAAAK
jgi:hypothetical protein